MQSWWEQADGTELRQGDFPPQCFVVIVPEDLDPRSTEINLEVETRDVIILTQSCDLVAQRGQTPRASLVAVCPVFS
ncbi:MAG: hypothetical protein ACR2PL_22820, partial [Dehalococcoidia bacterium]